MKIVQRMLRNQRIIIASTFLLFLTLAVPLLTIAQPQEKDQQRPNIILLVADDLRWDALGAYGNDIIQTPTIDRMAEEGVLFENMFVVTSICAPSRATIMTGQYPSRHGVRGFSTSLTPKQLELSYMGQLKKAGYRIGFIGKWGVGTPPPEGFLDYDKTFPGQGHYFHEVNGEKRHLTSIMGDQALNFLEHRSPEAPFMLSISFKAAHIQDTYNVGAVLYPYSSATSGLYKEVTIPILKTAAYPYCEQLPEFLKNSEGRKRWAVRFWGPERTQQSWKGYYRLISGIDKQVHRIRKKLEAEGLAENTIIIFTSDNGMLMGEHGLTGKWFPYKESMRVPLIVYNPRLEASQKGRRADEMVLTVDIAPTILALAGVSNQAQMQGHSIVPLLRGEATSWRTEFFYEHLFEHPRIPATEAVRTQRWKYIRYVDKQPVYEQLFDLKNDPNETRNLMLLEENEVIKKRMRRKWKELRNSIRD